MSHSIQPTLLCVASQKGGVGKTTSAISIAHKLALLGHEALLIDADAQGHAAISLGMNPEPCIFDWLTIHYAETETNSIRASGRPLLSLIPGDSRTRQAEQLMAMDRIDLAAKLSTLLAAMPAPPAYIVFDTSAGGALQETIMQLADAIVIPVRLETLGMDGVAATLGLLAQLRPQDGLFSALQDKERVDSWVRNSAITILPVMFDKRLDEHKHNMASLLTQYGNCVAGPVPSRVAVAEAVAVGRTIWEYKAQGIDDVRMAYSWLVSRITSGVGASLEAVEEVVDGR